MAEKKQSSKDSKSGKKKQNAVVKFFKDLRSEFKKVVWPSSKTVVNNTSVVLVTMVVCGLAIWGIDSAFAYLLKQLLSMAG